MSKVSIYKLPAEDVIKQWKYMGYYIEEALVPIAGRSEFLRGNIMAALETGKLTCWVGFEGEDLQAIATTSVVGESISGCRQLLIYSLSSVGNISKEMFNEGIKHFKSLAKSLDCQQIVAYSAVPSVISFCVAAGFQTFGALVLDVNKEK